MNDIGLIGATDIGMNRDAVRHYVGYPIIRLNLLPIYDITIFVCLDVRFPLPWPCSVSVSISMCRLSSWCNMNKLKPATRLFRHWVNRISEHTEMSTLCLFRYGIGLRDLSSTKFSPTSDKRHNDGCLGCWYGRHTFWCQCPLMLIEYTNIFHDSQSFIYLGFPILEGEGDVRLIRNVNRKA